MMCFAVPVLAAIPLHGCPSRAYRLTRLPQIGPRGSIVWAPLIFPVNKNSTGTTAPPPRRISSSHERSCKMAEESDTCEVCGLPEGDTSDGLDPLGPME